jgi:hypothetical protein
VKLVELSGKKKRDCLKEEINEPETNSKSKSIRDLYKGVHLENMFNSIVVCLLPLVCLCCREVHKISHLKMVCGVSVSLTVYDLPQRTERPQPKGLVNRMFGAMSSTVRYGNQVLDVVQKKTNGIVSTLPTKALYFGQSPS